MAFFKSVVDVLCSIRLLALLAAIVGFVFAVNQANAQSRPIPDGPPALLGPSTPGSLQTTIRPDFFSSNMFNYNKLTGVGYLVVGVQRDIHNTPAKVQIRKLTYRGEQVINGQKSYLVELGPESNTWYDVDSLDEIRNVKNQMAALEQQYKEIWKRVAQSFIDSGREEDMMFNLTIDIARETHRQGRDVAASYHAWQKARLDRLRQIQ